MYIVLVVMCVVILIVDCVYNVYVYHNELKYYLESVSGRRLADKDEVDKELVGLDKQDNMNDTLEVKMD
jgi:hypothetical protein